MPITFMVLASSFLDSFVPDIGMLGYAEGYSKSTAVGQSGLLRAGSSWWAQVLR